ncbi:MAG: zinc-ribbon domain-containing protein [Ideonella sp.]|nr:zinc-ribbon domain-containing protein [Ideonella sp.]
MSLATRCTSCNTVFRVVQDQLKVSEGWVRCGRCDAVFNALEGLFDLEPSPAPAATPTTEAPASPPPEAPAVLAEDVAPGAPEPVADGEPVFEPAAAEPTPAASEAEAEAHPQVDASPRPPPEGVEGSSGANAFPHEPLPAFAAQREPVFVESPPEPFGANSGADFDATPASRVEEQDRIDFADARFNTALLAEEGIATGDSILEAAPDSRPPAPTEAPLQADAAPPEFLRKAERDARWASPRARWTLALASLALLALLGAQVALHYRDLVVTLLPETRPALQALCEATGCRIEPLRRIDDIVIESSSLNALPGGGDAVRLSVVLRNRGVFPLAFPAIELTLTDAGGQMIARRILPPGDFGVAAAAVLPAASEAPLQLVLTTSGRRASGYTVEPFYP